MLHSREGQLYWTAATFILIGAVTGLVVVNTHTLAVGIIAGFVSFLTLAVGLVLVVVDIFNLV